MMRARIREGRLVLNRGERVTQYRLPPGMYFLYAAAIGALIFFLANPVVMSLAGQAISETDINKLRDAWQVTVQKVTAEARNIANVSRPPVDSHLPTYHLHLPDNTLQEMQKALNEGDPDLNHEPGGTKPYFKALLQQDGKARRVKVCLRGTMHWHHRVSKPSFRIRLRKDDTGRGDRYIELTTPEDSLVLNNWLPMQLAGSLELMNDASRHVRLFINKKYFGVYVRSTRPGEPFALANGRMPGTFFKAEFSEKMWESSEAWKTFGQEDPADIAVLQRWLDLLRGPVNGDTLQQFHTVFDSEKFARWAALMTVAGSIHTDDRHNHSYFFCSNQGLLEPMPWDVNGYGLHTQPDSPVDVQVQPVLRFLSADARWLHRRNKWIHQLLTGPGSTTEITETINRYMQDARSDLEADRNLGDLQKFTGTGWNWMPVSAADLDKKREQMLDWVAARNEYLHRYLDYARFSIEPDDNGGCLVRVFGTVAIVATDTVTGQTQTLYPGISEKRWIHTSHQQQADIQFPYLRPAAQTWRLAVPPERLVFRNAITGKPVNLCKLPADEAAIERDSRTIPVEQFLPEPSGHISLGPGQVTLDRDLIVGRYQTLTVQAGTRILLAPGVGIYSEGKSHFAGTPEEPIRISGSHHEPWASIGITGPQTAGTVFEHVHVDEGSIGKLNELRFRGMLNVYNCPHVTLRHCRIGANRIGDDAVNLAESSIVVEDCSWTDARSDALDLDMCTGHVANCRWENSGNDGLDLMGCVVTVRDCQISGSGDKGISVGENTRLKAVRNSISRCLLGTEIKDDSVAEFVECVFEHCHTAVHSYQKKWFYAAGGTCALIDCRISGSHEEDVDMQARCTAILVRTPFDRPDQSSQGIKQLESLPPEWAEMIQPSRYPLQRESL